MGKGRVSKLEEIVKAYLAEAHGELLLVERARAIKKTRSGKSRYELDIYIPELSLAFEVQDFTTHSRESDEEIGHPWRRNGIKNGPRHHELKRRLALEQLSVTVLDIWEDEILDGSFHSTIEEAISRAFGKIS